MYQKQCAEFELPPPLPLNEFNQKDWKHASKYSDSDLASGYRLMSTEDLEKIPRKHSKFGFCHPGPVHNEERNTDGWYYADSIVQSVKLTNEIRNYYVIRWLGYEDK